MPVVVVSARPYLEAYFQVLAELRAAAQFAVQALVDEAVQLVGAVAAVVLAVAEQHLVDAIPVDAGVRGVVAFLLCGGTTDEVTVRRRRPGGLGGSHGPTWAAAARVLGGLVRPVVAVEVAVALPRTLDEAAAVGAAELFGPARWVFWDRRETRR